MEHKILHTDKYFDVVEVNGQRGFKTKSMSIAVMPFTVDENDQIHSVGFLKEYNPFREGNYALTIITGTVENEDDDLIDTAIRELDEEGGIVCPSEEKKRFIYLGNFYPYKDSDRMVPTFAVDVTGLEINKAEGDGSKVEELSTFHMMPVNEGIATDELLPLGAFLRLFNYFYMRTLQSS